MNESLPHAIIGIGDTGCRIGSPNRFKKQVNITFLKKPILVLKLAGG